MLHDIKPPTVMFHGLTRRKPHQDPRYSLEIPQKEEEGDLSISAERGLETLRDRGKDPCAWMCETL